MTSRLLPVELRKLLCFLVWLLAPVSALLFLLQHIELNWKLPELLKLVFIVFSFSGVAGLLLCFFNQVHPLSVRPKVKPVGCTDQYSFKKK